METLYKCPICGGKLEYNMLCQYSNVYGIKRNGKLTEQRKRKEDVGSMECGFISCTNGDFLTDCELNVIEPCDSNVKVYYENSSYYYRQD